MSNQISVVARRMTESSGDPVADADALRRSANTRSLGVLFQTLRARLEVVVPFELSSRIEPEGDRLAMSFRHTVDREDPTFQHTEVNIYFPDISDPETVVWESLDVAPRLRGTGLGGMIVRVTLESLQKAGVKNIQMVDASRGFWDKIIPRWPQFNWVVKKSQFSSKD